MKQVAILTTFYETTSGYSLIAVAETQIKMLLDAGYSPVVIVQDNFTEPDDPASIWHKTKIDIRPVLPFLHLTDGVADDFNDRAEKVHAALADALEDCNVCITHDIMLQTFYKEHNIAVRKLAEERPEILWLHWLHSCPMPGGSMDYPELCRYIPPPGYLVYPNEYDVPMVCRTYGLQDKEWRVKVCRAGHAINPLDIYPYDPLTVSLTKFSGLHLAEVAAVYPVRLDRGKQPEKIIRLMAGVRAMRYDPRLLIIDWQSTGERFQRYIEELLRLAKELGIGHAVKLS